MTTPARKIRSAADYAAAAHDRQAGAVVVGIDGSATSRAALAWALREARLLEAPLTICHVHPVAGLAGTHPVGADVGAETLERAETTAVHALGPDRVTAALRHGDAARGLARIAEGARMLVIGTHGSMSHGARLFAPLSLRIITRAPCPVVAVPLMAGRTGPFAGHVVVGVDGSATAREALEFGFAHASRHGLPLAAVHVTDEPSGDYWTDDQFLDTHFAEEPPAETLLATEVEPWELRYPDVPTKRAVYSGQVAPGLLRAAAGAQLLAVGDRGRGLAARTVLGSVAQHMVGAVTCPLAVVRAATEPRG
jgi:nucleotide-binding universal stress UspA family protein